MFLCESIEVYEKNGILISKSVELRGTCDNSFIENLCIRIKHKGQGPYKVEVTPDGHDGFPLKTRKYTVDVQVKYDVNVSYIPDECQSQ